VTGTDEAGEHPADDIVLADDDPGAVGNDFFTVLGKTGSIHNKLPFGVSFNGIKYTTDLSK
jgi:hypothetical protein